MSLIAIYNPVCGAGNAKSFFYGRVLPLLREHGKNVDKVFETEGPGHAGNVLLDSLGSLQGALTVVLGSGDGTLHEIINALSSAELRTPFRRLHIALVPCGTANALYSSLFPPPVDNPVDDAYRLQSIHSYLNGSRTVPLTLATTTLSPSPSSVLARPEVTISSVVVSTALHAAILHDSESLRREIPGIERFQVAARNNSTKWYNSRVRLLPTPLAGAVQVYDPSVQDFVSHPESEEHDPIVELEGPFAYFLSTVNVDRLEPAFQITPLASKIPPTGTSCDIVVVRPLRNPKVLADSPNERADFVPKLWTVLQAAYKSGSHVDLRYDSKGEVVTEGDGPTVAEYFRSGGWEWIPDEADEGARVVCSDGAISHIKSGGQATCLVATADQTVEFAIHA